MSCEHTIRSLLSRTQFAKDAPAMRRSLAVFEQYQSDSVSYQSQMALNAARRTSNMLTGNVSLVSDLELPTINQAELSKITDHAPWLDPLRPLLRDYAAYKYDHADVYNAAVSLFGDRTMGPDASPADALAFVAMAAVIIVYAEGMGCGEGVDKELYEKALVLATLVSLKEEIVSKDAKRILADEGQTALYKGCFLLLLRTEDKVSSMMTYAMMDLMRALIGFSGEVWTTPMDRFMDYVAKCKGVPKSDTEKFQVTTRGRILLKGELYAVSGYCLDGVILSRVSDAVEEDEDGICDFSEMFFKVFPTYNSKNAIALCGGCSLGRTGSAQGRLSWYENALCCADLETAREIRVEVDGRVKFLAERMVVDERKNMVLRTGMRAHECDLYDMHMLGGLGSTESSNLSCLFEVQDLKIWKKAECNGVAVWATVERMDHYEIGETGMIRSITHGGKKKYASREEGCLRWTDDRNSTHEFTIDDVVK